MILVCKSVFPDVLLLSVVAYSVVMGGLMASGKEVIGRIPKGKVKITISPFQTFFTCRSDIVKIQYVKD